MSGFTGTRALLRLALRRDRIIATVWILGLAAFALSQAISMVALYPTEADLAALAASAATAGSNPGVVALSGLPYDVSTYGGATAWQTVTFQAALTGLMSLLLVVRHTRAEEEAGRTELVSALPVGRYAWLAASLLFVLVINLVLAGLIVLGFVALDLPVEGSLSLAAGCGLVGLVFAVVAALTAQVTERAALANGMAAALLGAAFLLRAAGDANADAAGNPAWPAWLSPIGWAQAVRPYVLDRWEILLLPLAVILVLLVAVAALVRGRDAGAGVLPARLGPPTASPLLRSPLALAWRLQRGALRGWTIGLIVTGAVFGGLAQDMQLFAEQDPTTAEIFAQIGGGRDLVDVYLATVFGLLGVVVAGYAVQATLRLRSEETAGRAEPVLATAVSRIRWAGSHVLWAAFGSAAILAAAGLAGGLLHGLQSGDVGREVPRVLGAALIQVPAAWLLAAIAVLLFGILPRLVALAWAAVAGAMVIGQFGELFQLDRWVLNLSPFSHLPELPGVEVSPVPLLWIAASTVLLVVVGLGGLRRRDIG